MMREHWPSILEFDEVIGKLEFTELVPYGIEPDGLCGDFWSERLTELQNLCRQWPELHIVSELNERRVNRFEPTAPKFYLGNGDKDPNLELCLKFVYRRQDFEKALVQLLSRPESERNPLDRFLIRLTQAVLESDDPFAHSNFRQAMGWE